MWPVRSCKDVDGKLEGKLLKESARPRHTNQETYAMAIQVIAESDEALRR